MLRMLLALSIACGFVALRGGAHVTFMNTSKQQKNESHSDSPFLSFSRSALFVFAAADAPPVGIIPKTIVNLCPNASSATPYAVTDAARAYVGVGCTVTARFTVNAAGMTTTRVALDGAIAAALQAVPPLPPLPTPSSSSDDVDGGADAEAEELLLFAAKTEAAVRYAHTTIISLINGTVAAGTANAIIVYAPTPSDSRTLAPLSITVEGMSFVGNGVLALIGALPPNSTVILRRNTFVFTALPTQFPTFRRNNGAGMQFYYSAIYYSSALPATGMDNDAAQTANWRAASDNSRVLVESITVRVTAPSTTPGDNRYKWCAFLLLHAGAIIGDGDAVPRSLVGGGEAVGGGGSVEGQRRRVAQAAAVAPLLPSSSLTVRSVTFVSSKVGEWGAATAVLLQPATAAAEVTVGGSSALYPPMMMPMDTKPLANGSSSAACNCSSSFQCRRPPPPPRRCLAPPRRGVMSPQFLDISGSSGPQQRNFTPNAAVDAGVFWVGATAMTETDGNSLYSRLAAAYVAAHNSRLPHLVIDSCGFRDLQSTATSRMVLLAVEIASPLNVRGRNPHPHPLIAAHRIRNNNTNSTISDSNCCNCTTASLVAEEEEEEEAAASASLFSACVLVRSNVVIGVQAAAAVVRAVLISGIVTVDGTGVGPLNSGGGGGDAVAVREGAAADLLFVENIINNSIAARLEVVAVSARTSILGGGSLRAYYNSYVGPTASPTATVATPAGATLYVVTFGSLTVTDAGVGEWAGALVVAENEAFGGIFGFVRGVSFMSLTVTSAVATAAGGALLSSSTNNAGQCLLPAANSSAFPPAFSSSLSTPSLSSHFSFFLTSSFCTYGYSLSQVKSHPYPLEAGAAAGAPPGTAAIVIFGNTITNTVTTVTDAYNTLAPVYVSEELRAYSPDASSSGADYTLPLPTADGPHPCCLNRSGANNNNNNNDQADEVLSACSAAAWATETAAADAGSAAFLIEGNAIVGTRAKKSAAAVFLYDGDVGAMGVGSRISVSANSVSRGVVSEDGDIAAVRLESLYAKGGGVVSVAGNALAAAPPLRWWAGWGGVDAMKTASIGGMPYPAYTNAVAPPVASLPFLHSAVCRTTSTTAIAGRIAAVMVVGLGRFATTEALTLGDRLGGGQGGAGARTVSTTGSTIAGRGSHVAIVGNSAVATNSPQFTLIYIEFSVSSTTPTLADRAGLVVGPNASFTVAGNCALNITASAPIRALSLPRFVSPPTPPPTASGATLVSIIQPFQTSPAQGRSGGEIVLRGEGARFSVVGNALCQSPSLVPSSSPIAFGTLNGTRPSDVCRAAATRLLYAAAIPSSVSTAVVTPFGSELLLAAVNIDVTAVVIQVNTSARIALPAPQGQEQQGGGGEKENSDDEAAVAASLLGAMPQFSVDDNAVDAAVTLPSNAAAFGVTAIDPNRGAAVVSVGGSVVIESVQPQAPPVPTGERRQPRPWWVLPMPSFLTASSSSQNRSECRSREGGEGNEQQQQQNNSLTYYSTVLGVDVTMMGGGGSVWGLHRALIAAKHRRDAPAIAAWGSTSYNASFGTGSLRRSNNNNNSNSSTGNNKYNVSTNNGPADRSPPPLFSTSRNAVSLAGRWGCAPAAVYVGDSVSSTMGALWPTAVAEGIGGGWGPPSDAVTAAAVRGNIVTILHTGGDPPPPPRSCKPLVYRYFPTAAPSATPRDPDPSLYRTAAVVAASNDGGRGAPHAAAIVFTRVENLRSFLIAGNAVAEVNISHLAPTPQNPISAYPLRYSRYAEYGSRYSANTPGCEGRLSAWGQERSGFVGGGWPMPPLPTSPADPRVSSAGSSVGTAAPPLFTSIVAVLDAAVVPLFGAFAVVGNKAEVQLSPKAADAYAAELSAAVAAANAVEATAAQQQQQQQEEEAVVGRGGQLQCPALVGGKGLNQSQSWRASSVAVLPPTNPSAAVLTIVHNLTISLFGGGPPSSPSEASALLSTERFVIAANTLRASRWLGGGVGVGGGNGGNENNRCACQWPQFSAHSLFVGSADACGDGGAVGPITSIEGADLLHSAINGNSGGAMLLKPQLGTAYALGTSAFGSGTDTDVALVARAAADSAAASPQSVAAQQFAEAKPQRLSTPSASAAFALRFIVYAPQSAFVKLRAAGCEGNVSASLARALSSPPTIPPASGGGEATNVSSAMCGGAMVLAKAVVVAGNEFFLSNGASNNGSNNNNNDANGESASHFGCATSSAAAFGPALLADALPRHLLRGGLALGASVVPLHDRALHCGFFNDYADMPPINNSAANTGTRSHTATLTLTTTASATSTASRTVTRTTSRTRTPTASRTVTISAEQSHWTPTAVRSESVTNAVNEPAKTATLSHTVTASKTGTASRTVTPTASRTVTISAEQSHWTPTAVRSESVTNVEAAPAKTATPSHTVTATATSTVTPTASRTVTISAEQSHWTPTAVRSETVTNAVNEPDKTATLSHDWVPTDAVDVSESLTRAGKTATYSISAAAQSQSYKLIPTLIVGSESVSGKEQQKGGSSTYSHADVATISRSLLPHRTRVDEATDSAYSASNLRQSLSPPLSKSVKPEGSDVLPSPAASLSNGLGERTLSDKAAETTTPTATVTRVRPLAAPTTHPTPPSAIAAERIAGTVGVAIAATGAVSTLGRALGVANAMARMAVCGDDDDGFEGSLPILVHPLRFSIYTPGLIADFLETHGLPRLSRNGNASTSDDNASFTEDDDDDDVDDFFRDGGLEELGAYAGAALSNTIILPLAALVVFGLFAMALAYARYVFRRGQHGGGHLPPPPAVSDLLVAVEFPSVLIVPFCTFGEAIGASIVRTWVLLGDFYAAAGSIVSMDNSEGDADSGGGNPPAPSAPPLVAFVFIIAVVSTAATALLLAWWVWILCRRIPRDRLVLVEPMSRDGGRGDRRNQHLAFDAFADEFFSIDALPDDDDDAYHNGLGGGDGKGPSEGRGGPRRTSNANAAVELEDKKGIAISPSLPSGAYSDANSDFALPSSTAARKDGGNSSKRESIQIASDGGPPATASAMPEAAGSDFYLVLPHLEAGDGEGGPPEATAARAPPPTLPAASDAAPAATSSRSRRPVAARRAPALGPKPSLRQRLQEAAPAVFEWLFEPMLEWAVRVPVGDDDEAEADLTATEGGVSAAAAMRRERQILRRHLKRYGGNALGDKRLYYCELIAFICSLIVGGCEGAPDGTPAACRTAVVVAAVAALVQSGCSCLVLIRAELAVELCIALGTAALSALAVARVFGLSPGDATGGPDEFAAGAGGYPNTATGRLDYSLAVVSVAVNIASLVALALALVGLALGSCCGDEGDEEAAEGAALADGFSLRHEMSSCSATGKVELVDTFEL